MSDTNQSAGRASDGSASTGAGPGAMPPLPPHTEWFDHSRAVWPVALAIIFEAFAITTVVLRIWSLRLNRKQKLTDHDWAILVALLFSSALVALLISATVIGGLGQHASLLSNPSVQLVHFGKIYVANSPVWAAVISAVKISILLLYIKLFHNNKLFRIVCWVIVGVQCAWFVAVTLAGLLYCQPLAIVWNPLLEGRCGDATAAYLSAHIINLLLDIAVAVAPIPVLFGLQMKSAKKTEIAGIFALGIAICAITITRIILIKDLVQEDITYTSSNIFFFTILEPLLGIVLACLPVLRPAMNQIASVFTGSRKSLLNSDYSSASKSRGHNLTKTATGKYSTVSSSHARSDSLTKPINMENSYAMETMEANHHNHDSSRIQVTNTSDVERR